MKKIIILSLLVAGMNGLVLLMQALPPIDPAIASNCNWNGQSLTCANIKLPAGATLVNGTLDNAAACGYMITYCAVDQYYYHIKCAQYSMCVPPQEITNKSYTKLQGDTNSYCDPGIYYDTLVGGWNLETRCSNINTRGAYWNVTLKNADTCKNDIMYCPTRGGSGDGTLVCTNACSR